jgi:hypothetical protein
MQCGVGRAPGNSKLQAACRSGSDGGSLQERLPNRRLAVAHSMLGGA